ncbi:hypothetical protein [Corynebacterium sp.]|uniref:hypothetical protein n=1 Tax=Corynebacterium sp. TaxID=1720 RepID=UPI0025C492D5|nr:hypothetical protein [Corynebacterium sp.]
MTSQEQSGAAGTERNSDGITRISRFTLSEDWAAVIVGLTILVLALAGVITEEWLVL